MGKLPVRLLAILITVGMAVLGSSDATAAPPVNCGPGPHWVDTCVGPPLPPHADVYPTSPLVQLDLDLDPNCLSDLNTPMTGPVTVHRQDASDNSTNFPLLPDPPILDAHIDAIDTEIVSMVLTGGGFILRAGAGGVPALLPSKGLVVEQATDNTKADSFFDVFFELDLGGGSGPKVFNQQPLRVTSVIGQVPPVGAVFMQPSVCLPLFTSPVAGSGIHVGNLAKAPRDHKTDANGDGYSAADEITVANCGVASCSTIITLGTAETRTCKDAGRNCGTVGPPADESVAARVAIPPANGYGCSVTLDTVPPLRTVKLAQSDVDLDGVVSILDLSKVASWFGNAVDASVTDPRWEGNLDGDGSISILDLSAIAANYLRSVANNCKVE